MGSQLLSLKGDKPFWSGYSRLTTSDRGGRRFRRLENCYVSRDGAEIRSFPGYGTFLDLTDINNSEGFSRYVQDAVRPVVFKASPDDPYTFSVVYDSSTSQTLWARAKPAQLFAFEQVGNEIVVIGESRFRECPIYDSNRDICSPASVIATVGVPYQITLDKTPAANSSTDGAGGGLNGIGVGRVIYVEGLTVADATVQAQIDAEVNDRYHLVDIVAGAVLTLRAVASASFAVSGATSAGSVHQIRPTRNDNYPTTAKLPYDSTYLDRPDDPDALTSWRVTEGVDMLSLVNPGGTYPCWPAWVANRQRDFGDGLSALGTEGLYTTPNTTARGASRREQRKLPYRPTITCAQDRVILAVPQYGCMFQIPMQIPLDPALWASPSDAGTTGVAHRANSIYDKPRSLGIPKPRLIESAATPAQPSPGDIGGPMDYSSSASAYFGSPTYGLDAGTYKVAISFEDAGTGQEGLASEPITVTIPSNTYAYTLRLNYIHPGYFMPEALPFKINIYMTEAGGEALAFFTQMEMEELPHDNVFVGGYPVESSAHYGFEVGTPTTAYSLVRSLDVPLPNDSGDLSSYLDPQRLAPYSATMPRGATAAKYVRGVLFSGGALGNAGPNGQLWKAKGSSLYTSGFASYDDQELHIRAHSLIDAAVPGLDFQDGDAENGTLGLAGRCFPDAYQGIDVITADLFPNTDPLKATDRVVNRRVRSLHDFESPTFYDWHVERVTLQRPVFDRNRRAGLTPGALSLAYQEVEKSIYYRMPQGQLQIGDPGAPERSSRAFIKIVDPAKGDDITGIGTVGGSTIVCSKRETYSYSWYRNPAGEEPQLMSEQFGCIASNSMVEFDGGLAWISERGPVAIGSGLQHVGSHLAEDFYGQDRRYMRDSTGMMRHAWSVHDEQRGLVMWGMLRRDSTVSIQYEGATYNVANSPSDEILSRFPCDEVLVWSYNSNAFSTWVPPAGLEVYWMRPLRDSRGNVRMCFLAADNRIYALDDEWSDRNAVFNGGYGSLSAITASASAAGTASTTLTFGGLSTYKDGDATGGVGTRNLNMTLAPGMLVEFLDETGRVLSDTAIASVTTTSVIGGDSTIELSAPQTWGAGQAVRIGGRQRLRLVSNYIGAETADTMQVQRLQMRYSVEGSGHANARAKAFKSERGTGSGESDRVISFTEDGVWESLAWRKSGETVPEEIDSMGRRVSWSCGQVSAPDVAVQLEITGEAQVRIQDLSLEVG